MTEEQLLAELGKGPEEEAQELRSQMESLLAEVKKLGSQGLKQEALAKMKERKTVEAALNEIYDDNPGLKAQLES